MKKTIIILAALFLGFQLLSAQSMPFMAIGNDVENMGMGSAGIAANAGAGAFENNMAAAALYEGRMMADISYGMLQPKGFDYNVIGLGGFCKIGKKLAIGLNGQYFIESSYSMSNESGLGSGNFQPKEGKIGLGAAYRIIEGLAVGANFKMGFSTLTPEASSTVFAADIYAMYSIKGVNIGLGAINLGTKADYGYGKYAIPSMLKAGAGYSIAGFSCNAEADYQLGAGFMASVGAEYCIVDIVDVRAGYHYGSEGTIMPSHFSVGIGAEFFGVRINAAYLLASVSSPINGTLAFSLGYFF